MGRGRNLPTTEQEIRVYWADILTRKYPQKFTSSANILDAGECFACGVQVNPLHRAHIVARVSGGSDAADNLHRLCAVCLGETGLCLLRSGLGGCPAMGQ